MSFKKLNFNQLVEELNKLNFKQLHIHHTWKPAHKSFNGSNYNQVQQGMKNYHVNSRGWSDIAQHVTLFPDGIWLAGRAFNRNPASISGWNSGAFCVEMLGNFDKIGGEYNSLGYDKLEGAQKQQVLMLTKYFIDRYGEQSVKFHNENSGKTCPGNSINKAKFMEEARSINKAKPQIKPEVKPEVKPREPSTWAKDSWEWAKKEGVLDGTRARDEATREEFINSVHRLLDEK